jgi:hypothetical protein
MDKKWFLYGALVLLGVFIAPKVSPALHKVPVVGSILP